MIYCGYQGCGKSTYCRTHNNTVDLDSSLFKKTNKWEEAYINIAQSFSDENKKVFISAHKNVIDYLINNKIEFELIIPDMDKLAWRSRLEFRYFKNQTQGNLNAILDFDKNFDIDMEYYKTVENKGIKVHRVSATIITDIGEVIE